MSISGAIAVYFVCWWIVLFAILPFGVKSQSETGDTTPGTDPGAPTAPGLGLTLGEGATKYKVA